MTKTAFVTGATGFLGEALCRRLVEEGWEVAAVRRRSSDTSALSDLDIDWYVADVMDRDALTAAMPEGASVFHLAGLGLQQADAQTVYQVNLQGTKNVLDAAVANDAERVLFTSTAGTRGADGVADEDDVSEPVGAYQASKREAEELVAGYVEDGLDAVVVHPTSVFGAGDAKFTERLISLVRTPYMPVSLPGGVSFVGVDDVVDGMLAAMERGETGEHYILGGENLRFSEALEVIARESDGSAPPFVVPAFCIHLAGPVVGVVNDLLGTRMFPFDADMAKLSTSEMFYSSEKAKRDLGYDPTPFAELVAPAVAWYDEKHGSADASTGRAVADGAGDAADGRATDEGNSGGTEDPAEPLA